jgi:hypothetical protein
VHRHYFVERGLACHEAGVVGVDFGSLLVFELRRIVAEPELFVDLTLQLIKVLDVGELTGEHRQGRDPSSYDKSHAVRFYIHFYQYLTTK